MTRLLTSLALLASIAAARPAAGQDTPTPTPRQILATVVDKQGAVVTDVRPDEVEVWIAGRRIPVQELGFVSADGDRMRALTLLIDDITLTPIGLARAKDVARRFVSRMAPGDQIAVMRLSGALAKSTDDPAVLRRAIDAISLPATAFLRPDDLSEHVLTNLAAISRQMGEMGARRRAIVGIGAPWLFDTPIPPLPGRAHLEKAWTDAARAIAGARVALYVIDPGGVGMSPFASGGRSGFAHDMGGHAFVNTNDLAGAADQVMREMATYYTIEVLDPPIRRGDPLREADVRVSRRNVLVRVHRLIPGG